MVDDVSVNRNGNCNMGGDNSEEITQAHKNVNEAAAAAAAADAKQGAGHVAAQEDPSMVPFYKLFAFADSYDWFLMALGTMGAIGHGLAFPIFFFFFGRFVHNLGSLKDYPDRMYHEVSKIAVFFAFVGTILFVASWTEVACWISTGERQTMKLRIKYLEAILWHDVGFFDMDARTGETVNSISINSLLIQEAISEKMGNFIHYVSTFFGGIAAGFLSVWQLGLVTLAIVPAIAAIGAIYAYIFTRLTSRSQKAYNEAGNVVEEAVSQVRTIYSFTGEEKTTMAYSAALTSTLKLGYRAAMAKGLGMGAVYAVSLCAWALMLWYGGVLVRKGSANGGKVLAAIFCVLMGGFALGQSSPNIATFAKARAAAFKIMKTMDERPVINSSKLSGKCLDKVHGEIELCNVSFSYPSRPDVPIFQDFSLKIPAGRSVAIVGGSGSGKSTIVSLIERFYDPTAGEILLDGHDIRTLQLKWLRERIGIVTQEPALFATTIEENILYGNEDATMEDIQMATKAANAYEFISHLPEGYKTSVGMRGVQLSGGQKQRVAIARALLKNPAILLLDEATSALDAESESVVQDALNRIMVGRTTVIVAHRLSTIQNSDFIAVLQNGKLVEMGTHDELVSEGGVYSTLVRLQETGAKEAPLASSRLSQSSSRTSSFRRLSNVDEKTASGRFSLSKLKSFTSREDEEDETDNSKLEGKHVKSLLWRLLKLNSPEIPFLLLGFLGSICSGLPNPAYSFLIAEILGVYYKKDFGAMKRDIEKYALILVLVAVGSVIAFFVQHYFFGVAGENLTKRVREMMLSGILRNEISWFDQEGNGSSQLSSRLGSDAIYVRAATGDLIAIVVQNMSVVVAAFAIGFAVEWRMAIVVAATFPLVVASMLSEKFFMKGLAGDMSKAHARASMLAGEAVSNIRTVAAFNAEAKLVNLVAVELHGTEKESFVRGNAIGFVYGLSSFLLFGCYGLGLWHGGVLVKSGKAEFGAVVKSFLVLILAAFPIAETVALIPDMTKAGHALKSVFEILDRQTSIDPDSHPSPSGEKVSRIRGDVELREVEFAYPSRPDVTIFKSLSLKVASGQSLALVGASGSGKSSIIALVERFYDPLAGAVLVDGKDIRKLNLKLYRQQVGLVQQEPALFATSIRENILYGKDGASEAEIVAAAKAANAHGFTSSLPQGYDTSVGERGVQLSGGQKQRVAIARAMLKNPAILLLDEATSALDAESERIVQEALDRLMRNRTTIVVAHRLSTIRKAGQIAVLQDGEIVEQGRHAELANGDIGGGAYARLIRLQQAENWTL